MKRTYPRQARTPLNVTGYPALAMLADPLDDGPAGLGAICRRLFRGEHAIPGGLAWQRAAGTDETHPPVV
jgi:aspartyl-tRNA(Asn)/glutamyl-tRNA(Gln) amidotransferase subunit A